MQTKKSWIDLSAGAGTGGGMQGMHPPPSDLKRYWHDTWFHCKSSPKYFCTAHYL